LDEARVSLAYDAHTAGGDAEQSLAQMNKERLARLDDIQMLEVALNEATRRIEAAEREVALQDAATKAQQAMDIAARIGERGKKLDELLVSVVEEAHGWKADLDELHLLGPTHPTLPRWARGHCRRRCNLVPCGFNSWPPASGAVSPRWRITMSRRLNAGPNLHLQKLRRNRGCIWRRDSGI
jgi:hypothetical protein